MFQRRIVVSLIAGSLALSPLMVGCENLPGDEKTQGAVIGGLGGAAAGALIGGEDNRLLGALIGGAAGAGGGYLIGANWDKITGEDDEDRSEAREEAIRANERAQRDPADPDDVDRARTADINEDGFVTLDEVVAMDKAGPERSRDDQPPGAHAAVLRADRGAGALPDGQRREPRRGGGAAHDEPGAAEAGVGPRDRQ